MAWTTPRTWSPRYHVTAANMNEQVRDNLAILKTNICNLGWPKTGVKTFAYSAGTALSGAGTEELPAYRVTIPAGFLGQPGDALILEGSVLLASNTNWKYMKFSHGAGALSDCFASNVNLANSRLLFRHVIRRRTAILGSLTGVNVMCVGTTSPVAPSNWYLCATTIVLDCANAADLKVWFGGGAAADLTLADYGVWAARGVTGATV